ncbi:hypothetical protein Q5P01_012968 [Channa striata]|uniref:Uncharacterized protein n=1 Tax=Channa striata TaxID=64152 RepID=A0AA88SNK7_CHASR|nr:hypothetical protein Q5P01_012968 [Channa striata]
MRSALQTKSNLPLPRDSRTLCSSVRKRLRLRRDREAAANGLCSAASTFPRPEPEPAGVAQRSSSAQFVSPPDYVS